MTKPSTQYAVLVHMIQLQSPSPIGSHQGMVDRTLRHGDLLPTWTSRAELDRLLELGAIEALA